MPKRRTNRFSIENEPLYPHIKLTNEPFPRILATRLIAKDDAEYFGAFLNRTHVRILLDFLNRTFRLRSCEIEIDGSFNFPCTMHYKRRCLAPCVSDLVHTEQYQEMVGLVRLFLMNDRPLFRSVVATKIEKASEALEFEAAAKWRDILENVEKFWDDTRHGVWLEGTSDTYFARAAETVLDIFLISQKGRRVLGERVFTFDGADETNAADAISDVIDQFYRFHAPKEIRIAIELPLRLELQKDLSARFARRVPIVVLTEKNRKISTELAVYRSSAELDVQRSAIKLSNPELRNALKKDFALGRTPQKIFAVDASHISGTSTVVAMIGWQEGKIIESDYRLADVSGETAALTSFLTTRFEKMERKPMLLLIDGGTSQLTAALKADLPSIVSTVTAVKPPGQHSAVSHFLTIDGRIHYDPTRDTHRFLHRLRDNVHEFANAVHRDVRDYANFYEIASIFPSLTESERRRILNAAGSNFNASNASEEVLLNALGNDRAQIATADQIRFKKERVKTVPPLVVPTRLQDPDGAADDLIPIEATSRKPKRRRH